MLSAICCPTVNTGFKEVIGFWKTIENSFPRSSRILRSPYPAISSPLTRIFPFLIFAFSGSSFIMLLQSTLFPQPDSPTTASTSPAFREKLTSRTACTSPSSVKKLTERCSTFNRSFIPFFSCTDKKGVNIPPSSAFLFILSLSSPEYSRKYQRRGGPAPCLWKCPEYRNLPHNLHQYNR